VALAALAVLATVAIVVSPWWTGASLPLIAAGALSVRSLVVRERRFDLHRLWSRRRI
jgi:hypothetical protein